MTTTDEIFRDLKFAFDIARYIQSKAIDIGMKLIREEHFVGGINPYFNQTKCGLYLEEYYGLPSVIYTPIGKWTIIGVGDGVSKLLMEHLMEHLKETLGLELDAEGKQEIWGHFGPVWRITKWENRKLPEAFMKKGTEYIEYERAKEIYAQFLKRNPIIGESMRFSADRFSENLCAFLRSRD